MSGCPKVASVTRVLAALLLAVAAAAAEAPTEPVGCLEITAEEGRD